MLDEHTGNLIVMAICILLSAFFSSSESAFLSLQNTARLTHLVSIGNVSARRVSKMLDNPGRLLSTILLCNNLVNVAFTASITIVAVSTLGNPQTGVLVATILGTSILLVFGEVLPKTLAVRHSERLAFSYARSLQTIEVFLLPLVAALDWITQILSIGQKDKKLETSITEEELLSLIDVGEAEGAFQPEEAEMLESVFRFGDRQVRDIMTPRNDIISVGRGASLSHVLDMYASHAHTRFPVFKETADNLVGILSAKDLLKAMATRTMDFDDPVTETIRDAYFVPETKRIAELFDELRRSGNQMAIAVDEYGGVAGLVTLKQLLEEIAGKVGEEGIQPEEEYEAIGENTFQVDGGMGIDEITDELGIKLPEGDFETVAGFVLNILGHIPTEGEQFDHSDIHFEVSYMKGLKIETVTITKNPRRQPEKND
tara:strand:+ start:2611 stop:3897 length:1287 start_codon:yes stop_codon:yes gene_type:complete